MAVRKQSMNEGILFTKKDERISELLQCFHEIWDLQMLGMLAYWDQQTTMPRGANEARMYQMATLKGIIHERLIVPRLGELLKELDDIVKQDFFTDADRGLVRQAYHLYQRETKLPRTLVEEIAQVQVIATESWIRARQQNDFAIFAPWLKRTVDLQREVAERIGFAETRYDALLNEYEPEMTATRIQELFAPVRTVSMSILRYIQLSGKKLDTSCLYGSFPIERQQVLSEKIASNIGYDFTRGQITRSAHPFTTDYTAPADVRFTVRSTERNLLPLLMSSLHESGHALYEQGNAWILMRTPLAGGASRGIHESQARLWENVLGRSEAFWKGKYALLCEIFPEYFKMVDVMTFVHALNNVEPSPIRIEADEVSYNLHILIRFELEKALVDGDIAVESLPSLWKAKYREYIGIEPESDVVGVLQNVHWTKGFGSFPSYMLGNLYAAQIFQKLSREFPDYDQRLASGDTMFILQWLHKHLYASGAIYLPQELMIRLTGESTNSQHFVRYLTDKFQKLYSQE